MSGQQAARGDAARPGIDEFFDELHRLGIQLRLDGEELRLRAPKGSVSAPLKASIAQRKPQIVAWLREREREAAAMPELVPAPHEWHRPFELTQMQEAYWLGRSDAFALGGVSAHAYWEYEFDSIDIARVRHAVARLIERHDMLRAIVLESGQQQVLPHAPGEGLAVADLRAMGSAAREAALLTVREQMSGRGPRTDRWPLFDLRAHLLPQGRVRFNLSVSLLLVDGMSVELLAREVAALYREPQAELQPLALSFRDVVNALAAFRESAAYRRAKDYWLARLSDMPPAPELALAQSPGAVVGARLARRSILLDEAAWRRFQGHARDNGVFAASALCAAYCAVLARWSKHPRFTLNVLDGQRWPIHPQIQQVVGNFSSTTLTVVDAGDADTLQALARQLQHRRLIDRQHAAYPGVRVLREWNRLNGTASLAGVPVVFNSLLDVVGGETDHASAHECYAALQTPQVYLDHQVLPRGRDLELHWDAVEALFPAGMLDTMFDAYAALIGRLADDSAAWTAPSHGLPSPQPRALALEPGFALPEGTLHGHVLPALQRHGERVAIVSSQRTLTHAQTLELVRALAARLTRAGCGPGQLVGVVMDKGWEQVVAVLAINAAGAAYLPIDAALPAERIRHLLERGEVRVLLTQADVDAALDWPAGIERLCVDGVEPAPCDAEPLPESPARAHDLAYVIFTSGSTGEPKGVMIDHRGALNTVADISRRFAVGADDRVLAVSSLGFDLSVYDVYGLLAAGGAVVVPDAGDIRDPERLVRWMREQRITVWNSVPAVVEMLVEHLAGRGERLPASLRLVMMSGDWIPVTLPDRLRRLSDQLTIVSLGGATEASIWSIVHVIGEVGPDWKSIPYGRALAHQQVHVLDHRLGERETWVPGELYISGVGVALGYWRDPAQSDERFIAGAHGDRMYRTGDWGRYLPNGEIEFLGRDDLQVKVQGFRIELGEIESALQRHPSVRASVVGAVGPRSGGKRLVAHVVPRPGAAFDADALRHFLAQRLPSHMVPATILRLEELPLSANGKVDRKRLPQEAAPRAANEPVAPRNLVESQLLDIWHELLAHRPIGVADPFFEVGGDSLLAVRLSAAIQKRLRRTFSVSTLFKAPTIEKIAQSLQDQPDAGGSLVAVQPHGHRRPLFLVHPVGGNVLCYSTLARHLGADQPVFAFQSQGLDGRSEPHELIEDMAAGYVAELRRQRPAGPYRLGGWSMGGVIAAEMAAQLEAAGEAVEGVVLFDSVLPPPRSSVELPALLDRFLHDLGVPAATRARLAPLAAACDGSAPALSQLFGSTPFIELRIHDPLPLFAVFCANMRALKRFVPRPCKARQLLVRASSYAHEPGWRSPPCHADCVARLVVRDVEGDHFTMMSEPQVRSLALHVASFFETAGVVDGLGRTRRTAGVDA
ncbi:dihydroaeruginoic acid synthetase [Burkholderiaceae bacterium]|nr:dihydroaeruginoic acid synthetase [Burkholderiaceae bacterium]